MRRETAPLKGAYIADTLYLPEHVELGGHTVILVKNLVFEGHAPVVRGSYDLHFFPTQPIAVLGTTLAEAMRKKGAVLNVGFERGGKPGSLPRFSQISDVAQRGVHKIVFDVSGRDASKPEVRVRPSSAQLRSVSWGGVQDPDCTRGCDKSGRNQNPASPGILGLPGGAGVNPAKAADGDCHDVAISSNDGVRGEDATDGQEGGPGGAGDRGTNGENGGNIDARVDDNDLNTYVFKSNGGAGGDGGMGGQGGQGGPGGRGGDGGNGVACSCSVGRGGKAGHGGNGGIGGKGGNGGGGGDGGSGGTIVISLPAGSPGASWSNTGGTGGRGAPPGLGGTGGIGGQQGSPGRGAIACNLDGGTGEGNFTGESAANGANGDLSGDNGHNQQNGPQAAITHRTTGGGGGDPVQILVNHASCAIRTATVKEAATAQLLSIRREKAST